MLILVAAAVAVVAVGVGALFVLQTGGRDGGDSESTCAEIVAINGRIYSVDVYNSSAVDPSQLGTVIDRVDQEWPCNDAGDEQGVPTDGVVASALPPGTELRTVGGEPSEAMVAAVAGDEVRVYVDLTGDRFAFNADVTEIGINSAYDGTTRLATIDEPQLVRQLVDELRIAPTASRVNDATDLDDQQVFVELVRTDGLRTVVPYWINEDQLADRSVGASWSTAVAEALAAGPSQPIAEGITLTSDSGVARFHPNGSCRRDRPDLEVQPGQVLSVDLDDGLEVTYFYISPRPPIDVADSPPDPTYLATPGTTFTVPELVGTTIIEAGLAPSRPAGDVCTVLRVANP